MLKSAVRYFEEPKLTFGYDQDADDPRDGLFFFGPLMGSRHPQQMRVGVVGTPEGLGLYREWVRRITGFLPSARPDSAHHVSFPGFEACFRSAWPSEPTVEIPVSAADISRAIRLSDRHVAIFDTVSIFEKPIKKKLREDDVSVDLWFVVIPDEVHQFGRPLSRVPSSQRVKIDTGMNAKIARGLQTQPSLFEEDMKAAAIYEFDLNFHHQLKARLLDVKAVAQVVRESSIATTPSAEGPLRRMQDPATVAWNLTTSAYYKAGGRPWKLSKLREGVCYVGLVFKKTSNAPNSESACCGAQMFLDSGDGLVFKGALGNWYSRENREFHLSEVKARELITTIVDEYTGMHGVPPKELFIHAKTRLNESEWRGISAAVEGRGVTVVGVRISRSNEVKLYRPGRTPVLRGTAYAVNDRRGYLWTAGYVPRLETYAGREVPNPLSVEITRGEADLDIVLADVLSLTKLNFNACIYGDGLPVTLRFADAVGEILTARPEFDLPPLPFRHYI